jgi:hypothetical protein
VFRLIVTLILLLVVMTISLNMIIVIITIIMTRSSPLQTTTKPRQSSFHLNVSHIPNPTAK